MGGFLSVLPAIVMLILVLLTRRIVLSLGAGIVIGAFILQDFSFGQTLKTIFVEFIQIFYVDGSFAIDEILLLLFLLLLGIMTALLASSGGSQAFGEWMIKRVKTRRGSQLMTIFLGIIIFIDDYFNSLAVGQIARPLTDRHRVSRAKLAYYIDSTSAPVTVVSPISSWGAYIIGILGSIFMVNNITDLKPLTAFIQIIPYNFYAIVSLLLVFLVAIFNMNIGPMKKHENRAVKNNELIDPDPKKANIPGDMSRIFESHKTGKVYHLLVPIAVLIIVTVGTMLVTGALASEEELNILSIFANTDVNLSLFIGGLASVLVGFLFHFRLPSPRANGTKILTAGMNTMLPAIYILILAWMIGSIMDNLQTGQYLAEKVQAASISPSLLPFMFFLIAGLMSLSTGTSWGTFGIMLPIGAEVALNMDAGFLIPVLAAVLAGSVFGDHCTPISDTTILSSTGAGVNHIDHVVTQLPYAFIAAFSAGIGYLILGFTGSNLLALFVALIIPIVIGFGTQYVQQKHV